MKFKFQGFLRKVLQTNAGTLAGTMTAGKSLMPGGKQRSRIGQRQIREEVDQVLRREEVR